MPMSFSGLKLEILKTMQAMEPLAGITPLTPENIAAEVFKNRREQHKHFIEIKAQFPGLFSLPFVSFVHEQFNYRSGCAIQEKLANLARRGLVDEQLNGWTIDKTGPLAPEEIISRQLRYSLTAEGHKMIERSERPCIPARAPALYPAE